MHPIFLPPSPSNATELIALGNVFVIQYRDIFTSETLNIGICGVSNEGFRHTKVIQKSGRLEALYGGVTDSVLSLAKTANDAAMRGAQSPSEAIIFTTPTPYYNASLDDIVNATFKDQVTIAREPELSWSQGEVLRSDVGAVTHELWREGHDFRLETIEGQDKFNIHVRMKQHDLDELLNETYGSVIYTTTVWDIRGIARHEGLEIDGANDAGHVLDLLRADAGLTQTYNEQVLHALKTHLNISNKAAPPSC